MDFKRACEIFGFTRHSFTYEELKKEYYKLSLKYHPDRNKDDPSSTEKFQELYSAYECLCKDVDIYNKDTSDINVDTNNDYFTIFKRFLSHEYNIDVNSTTFIEDIINSCKKASLKIFENLDKKTAMNVFDYMEEYSEIVGIKDNVKDELKNILKNKIKNDECIILNSTIENMFNAEIYKLHYDNTDFYVPLWHDEITFDLSDDKILLVKCIPDLPDHLKIDHNNNLHVYIKVCSSSIFNRKNIQVKICDDIEFEIPVNELYITKYQIYTFYKYGIPLINTENTFSTDKKGCIYVHIEIHTF